MSQESLQAYFDEHTVKQIGRGSDIIAYGADDLVIKQPKSGVMTAGLAQALNSGKKASMSDWRETGKGAYEMAGLLQEKTRKNFREGLETLGGLVLPYEIPDEIVARVRWRSLPFIAEKETFYRPAVQERAGKEDMLDKRLKRAVKAGSVADVRALLEAVLETNSLLLYRGAFTQDPLPSNYAVDSDGRALLHDLGSITFQKRAVIGTLKTEEGQKGVVKCRDRILAHYLSFLRPLEGNPEIQRLIREFTKRFYAFYEPRAVAYMGSNKKRNPVPEVRIPGFETADNTNP